MGAEVKGKNVVLGIFFPKEGDLVRATLVNHEGKIDSKNSQISATSVALSLSWFSSSLQSTCLGKGALIQRRWRKLRDLSPHPLHTLTVHSSLHVPPSLPSGAGKEGFLHLKSRP